MKKITLFLFSIILAFSTSSFAQQEVKISKEEFLKRLDLGEFTLKRDPLIPGLSEKQRKEFMESMKRKYPTFREAFWFVPNLKTNNYVYTVFYEWPTQRCIFRVEGFDSKKQEYKRDQLDIAGSTIEKKYCEKAYGTKLTF